MPHRAENVVKRCPICNKSSADVRFYGEFCERCASDRLKEKLPSDLEVFRCRVCGKIRTKEGTRMEDKASLQSVIQQRFIKFKVYLISFGDGKAVIDVVDQRGGQPLAAEKEVEIRYRKMTCESCYKRIGGYYEATFQLRGDTERIERLMERLARYFENRGEFIAKVEKVDNGYDVYLSSKLLANAFISEREILAKTSYTLSGLDKSGKKVYKNTYAIRL
jgi:NMD protein affecting ribosome stability and mRNA decay